MWLLVIDRSGTVGGETLNKTDVALYTTFQTRPPPRAGKFVVPKFPTREVAVRIVKLLPLLGLNPTIRVTLRVPARVAVPVTLTWSNCVPAANPPISTLYAPAAPCV